jgi:hypothetical protein
MPTPRPSLLNLHPVEALLALLLISAAALLRLLRPQVAADLGPMPGCNAFPDDPTERLQAWDRFCRSATRLSVAELRTMARDLGLRQVGGRPIHKARRADLIAVLCS